MLAFLGYWTLRYPQKSGPIVPFGSCCSSNCLHSITHHSPRSCIWNLGLQSKEFIKGCHGQKFLGRMDCGCDEGEKRAEKRGPKVAISWSGKECVQPLLKHTCREKGKDVPGGGKRFTIHEFPRNCPSAPWQHPVWPCGPLDLYIPTDLTMIRCDHEVTVRSFWNGALSMWELRDAF